MGPLEGVRVVEFGGIGPGPFCAMLLADLGADVVRIDRPGGGGAGLPLSHELDLLNRGKRSVALELKTPGGLEAALRLVERADLLIEGFRPGVMERLGLGPDACLARNPRLVFGRMTGWGQDGPLAQRAGHDIAYLALTGVLHAIGRRDGPPAIPLNLIGDFAGGSLYLAIGLLAALHEARSSGRGQVVDAAIVDGVASLTAYIFGLMPPGLWRDRRGSNMLDGGCPWYDVYETADGAHMAVGPIEAKFYAEFVERLGIDAPDLPGQWDLARWPELRARFAARFKERTRAEWAAVFDGSDACVAPVLTFAETMTHPHVQARGTFVEVDGIAQPVPAPRFSRTPGAIRHGPPAPGSTDAEDVIAGWDAGARGV
jgi:alpha-methylacyl-CoA racemase